jgi:hypothetical protein
LSGALLRDGSPLEIDDLLGFALFSHRCHHLVRYLLTNGAQPGLRLFLHHKRTIIPRRSHGRT